MNQPTTPDTIDTQISAAADNLEEALKAVHRLLKEHCPGPHRPMQHKDNLPPYCRYCRRTTNGRRI